MPNPADEIRAAFSNSELGPYKHYSLLLPASAQTVRLRLILDMDSGSEVVAVDNIAVVLVPEPSSFALLATVIGGILLVWRRRG